ncbi:hypothetical protein CCR95_22415 [Thiocystis minor]|uniref:hypothetical protein n=1 Tax=Thiocystis minor TaxID=61597 RepID=UPI0019112B68|nr:hypothetical protein [Thiocystis minor]MBK5966753.1 hypothetical protein [Thiocystis minor]
MYPIDQRSELHRVDEPGLRQWLETRLIELGEEAITVRFWILEPDDDVLTACWLACWGEEPDATASLEDVLTVVEYVEEQPAFFAAVVPANHEAGLILIIPKSVVREATRLEQLQRASVTLEPTLI